MEKIPIHKHNNIDGSFRLNPKYFKGFPIAQVSDAAIAPISTPDLGTIIFQTDNKSGTPHWYQWVYLPNIKTLTNSWHYIQLT